MIPSILGYIWGLGRVLGYLFSELGSISALSGSFKFLVGGGGWWFPAITLSQPNYSYGCFDVGVVVVVGL